MNYLHSINIIDQLRNCVIRMMIPNIIRIIANDPLNISGSGKADDVIDTGDGTITRGAANNFRDGAVVGVAMLPGVSSSSAAKTSAFAW
jgi:hypothetical protein